MPRTRTPLAALLLAIAVFASGACSGSDPIAGPGTTRPAGKDPGATTVPRIDIDPRRYFDDYEQEQEADMATAAPNSSNRSSSGGATASVADESMPMPEPPRPPDIDEDNTFDDPGNNPFVATADDPQSTFGLDVDTGSFAIARTFLDQGQLPPTESIRTEEWVNAFGYGYAAPTEGDLGVAVDGAPVPFTSDDDLTTQLIRVGIQGRDVADAERPPANLTFVIDVSGSMDIRDRLGLVKSTLALLVLNLRDTDTLSIVTYSDDAAVLLEPTPVQEAQRIVDAIDELVPNNSTNMEAGLRKGYELAQETFRADAINTVILASDGVANAGVTGTDPLTDLIREQGREGIRLVTVGYGMGNYNDSLMEALADRGDGFYSYVDTYEEAERLFTGELTSTLTVIAGDAKAQVTFDPAVVESYRLIGYENRALADEQFEDDGVDAGELGAGHTVTALYEVRLTAEGEATSTPTEDTADQGLMLGEVALRHRSAASGEVEQTTVPILATDLAASVDDAAPGLRLAAAVAAFAELLADHPLSAEREVDLDRLAALADSVGADLVPDDLRAGPADLVELIGQARTAQ